MTVYQVTHLAAPHLPLFCPDHILMLSGSDLLLNRQIATKNLFANLITQGIY